MEHNSSKYYAWAIALLAAGGTYWLLSRRQSNPPSLINQNWDMSNRTDLPRGYRNNNPLNVRYSWANAWRGKVFPNTDGTFEQFSSMEYGYRAALYLMRKYIRKGYNTVAKIISRWAPENENNTQKYISDVCRIANLDPEMIVSLDDFDTLTEMAYAMSIIENGQTDATRAAGLPNMNIILEGWRLL